MQNKQRGMFALVLAGSTVLVIGLFVAVCWNTRIIQNNADLMQTDQMEAQDLEKVQVQNSDDESLIDTKTLQTYTDNNYGFEFKYPKGYSVNTSGDSSQSILLKNGSKTFLSIHITKWKGLKIEEGTPGTFWMKLGYGGWKYFVDNFNSIKAGECDEKAVINAAPTAPKKPSKCLITKTPDYIKIEMESSIVFHGKDTEIRFELGQNGNKTLMDGIASSLRFPL